MNIIEEIVRTVNEFKRTTGKSPDAVSLGSTQYTEFRAHMITLMVARDGIAYRSADPMFMGLPLYISTTDGIHILWLDKIEP